MTDELERNGDERVEITAGEETLEPRSKYERIMLAAAEASRLNEEMRRKGIKLDNKVTIEAIKRVDEGKVKGVLRETVEPEEEGPAPAAGAMPAGLHILGGYFASRSSVVPVPSSSSLHDIRCRCHEVGDRRVTCAGS